MSRWIDADALMDRLVGYHEIASNKQKANGISLAIGIVATTPTIDAVSVVRCSECRWSRPRTLKGETGYRCVFYRVDKAETGYCDIGEREGE